MTDFSSDTTSHTEKKKNYDVLSQVSYGFGFFLVFWWQKTLCELNVKVLIQKLDFLHCTALLLTSKFFCLLFFFVLVLLIYDCLNRRISVIVRGFWVSYFFLPFKYSFFYLLTNIDL